jgi:hypothetical protein
MTLTPISVLPAEIGSSPRHTTILCEDIAFLYSDHHAVDRRSFCDWVADEDRRLVHRLDRHHRHSGGSSPT